MSLKSNQNNHLKMSRYNIIIAFQEIARNSYVSFIVIFLLSQGLSFSEYSFYKMISLAIIVLLEVPFGMLGDKFGQKKIYISSLIFFIITSSSLLLVPINKNFYGMSELFYGLALSSFSGTIGTSKVNEIRAKDISFLKEYWRQKKMNNLISSSLGSVIGTILFIFVSNDSPFIFASLIFLITLILTVSFDFYEVTSEIDKNKKRIISKNQFNKGYVLLVTFNSFLPLLLIPVFNSWQIFYKESSLYSVYFLIFSLPIINSIKFISTVIFKTKTKTSPKFMLILSILMMGIPWFTILLWNDAFIFCFINFSFWLTIYNVIFFNLLSENMEDKNRSTLSSFNSLISRLSGLITLFIFGLSNDMAFTIFILSLISTILGTITISYYFFFKVNQEVGDMSEQNDLS